MSFKTSLLPIFRSRLEALKAIAPALRELPQPRLNELKSLLERAEKLVVETMEGPSSSELEPQR
jgi:hypothetical protein